MKEKRKGRKRLYGLKTAAVIVTAVMAASSTAVPAFAANDMGSATDPSATVTTKTVKGGKTTFDKYLVMRKNANVPNATFSYAVFAPDDDQMNYLIDPKDASYSPNPVDTNGTNLTVRKGIDASKVKASDTVFATGDQTFDSAQTVRTNSGSKTYDEKTADQVISGNDLTGLKYAKHTSTVDFSKVTFSEPGVYRYMIIENPPRKIEEVEKGINYDLRERYLDVYVESAENGTLSIKGYVFHTENQYQAKGNKDSLGLNNPDGKNKGFTNFYATQDLTLTKTVTGNQGFRDQYFKFHVDITNLDGGARLFLTDKDGNKSYTSKDTVPYVYNADTGRRDDGQKRFVAAVGKIEDITKVKADVDNKAPDSTATTEKEGEEVDADAKGLAITADESGHAAFDVYLKHGESLKINGLTYNDETSLAPPGDATNGAKYTITETSEDYSATASKTVTKIKHETAEVKATYGNHGAEAIALNATTGTSGTSVIPTLATSEPITGPRIKTETTTEALTVDNGGLIHNQDNHTDAIKQQTLMGDETVAFTNDREGTLPTGIYHNNRAIFNIIGIAAAGCAIAIVIRRRRKKEN